MVRETFDLSYIVNAFPALLKALPLTLLTAAVSFAAGCLLGLLLAAAKVSRHRVLSGTVSVITDVTRGIPTIVLLYLAYFALPSLVALITGRDISRWPKLFFVIVALSVELAALTSEMFRSAYTSLDKGQLDAAHSIGMTRAQRFFRVILPQGFYVILPNLSSAALALIQGTALAYTLGVLDVMGMANVLNTLASGLKYLESFVDVSLIYWGISLFVAWIFHLLEKRFGRGQYTAATQNRR